MWWLCRLQRYNMSKYFVLESWYKNTAEDLEAFQPPDSREDHPGLQDLYVMQEWAKIHVAKRMWKDDGGLQKGRRGSMLKQAAYALLPDTAPWDVALLRSGTPPAVSFWCCPMPWVRNKQLQRSGENFQRLSSSAFPQYVPSHGDVFSARPLSCLWPVAFVWVVVLNLSRPVSAHRPESGLGHWSCAQTILLGWFSLVT